MEHDSNSGFGSQSDLSEDDYAVDTVKDMEKPTKSDRDPAVKQAGRAIRKMQRLA